MDDLLQRARQGDNDAFAQLFEQSKQPLWNAAVAVLGNVNDAADVLQETAIKAWRAMPRFEARSGIGTWFMRILLRTAFDMRRTRERETPVAMTGAASGNTNTANHDGGADMVNTVAFDEAAIVGAPRHTDHDEVLDVRSTMRALSADDRLVLTLFYVNDFPTRQIALIMNLSEGAVRTRLSRARDHFKAAYTGTPQETEVVQ